MTSTAFDTRKNLALAAALLAAVAGIFALTAVAAPEASAQLPSVCEQYPNLPQCDLGPGETEEPPIGGPSAGPTGGPASLGGQGELPFTGYPLTALILLLIVLLLVGLALRSYLAVRDRITSNRTT